MAERDPDFVPKAIAIIELSLDPPSDGPTYCADEQPGIGVRTPAAPSQPVAPGQPARREFAYVRHGTADLLAAFEVGTGRVDGLVRHQHRSCAYIELRQVVDRQVPKRQVIHLIVDPVKLHQSAEGAVYISYRPGRFQFHWLPKHASWLSFIEAWVAILRKKCLKRREFADFTAAEQGITDFIATDNAHQAKPFLWRKGVKFYQRLKDKFAEQRHAATVLPEAA